MLFTLFIFTAKTLLGKLGIPDADLNVLTSRNKEIIGRRCSQIYWVNLLT